MKSVNYWPHKWQRRLGVVLFVVPAIVIEVMIAASRAARDGVSAAVEVWRMNRPDA